MVLKIKWKITRNSGAQSSLVMFYWSKVPYKKNCNMSDIFGIGKDRSTYMFIQYYFRESSFKKTTTVFSTSWSTCFQTLTRATAITTHLQVLLTAHFSNVFTINYYNRYKHFILTSNSNYIFQNKLHPTTYTGNF